MTLPQYKQELIQHCNKNDYNLEFIEKAVSEGQKLHDGQMRKSGEPYFVHPLKVAIEIADLDLGEDAVAAALLHDTIEDCEANSNYIEKEFNKSVAMLVEGVTKLDQIANNSLQRYTEIMNLRKLLISSASDIRVLLIKLADRLDNMRTIEGLKPERQISYSEETLKVYVPLAEYIGISKWKHELENIAFEKKEPEIFKEIQYKIEHEKKIHDKSLELILKKIKRLLAKNSIKFIKVYGRYKSNYSIFNKIKKQYSEGKVLNLNELDISKMDDLVAIRVILENDEIICYHVLGLIHASFNHKNNEFKDYIAKPKANGYRSIHTVIKAGDFHTEVQIRTNFMDEVNEYGPASHIAYKLSGKRNVQATNEFNWIKNLHGWSGKTNERDFKIRAFKDRIFVITPKGRVIQLSKGSTAIDFAYAIHSEVGNKFLGVKINDRIGKIDSELQNADLVEVLTSKNHKKPSLEWVQYAYSSSTKSKIKKAVSEIESFERIDKGKALISDYLMEKIKLDWFTLDSSLLRYICGEFGAPSLDQFYIDISINKTKKRSILQKLVKKLNIGIKTTDEDSHEKSIEEIKGTEKATFINGIVFEGVTNLEFKTAGCCKPLKGDEIIGVVTLRDGLKIHRTLCPELLKLSEERRLNAVWS